MKINIIHKIIAAISFLWMIPLHVFSQQQLVKAWDYRYGGDWTEILNTLLKTNDGGFLLAGYSGSQLSGNISQPNHATGTFDYWIVKTDNNGILQWEKRYGSDNNEFCNAAFQTIDGGYILAGVTQFQPNGDVTDSSRGGYDYWIIKIDASGNKQWDKRFGGSITDEATSIAQTTDGGYVICGHSGSQSGGDKTQNTKGSYDIWLVRTDSIGMFMYDADFGGNASDSYPKIIATDDGGFLIGSSSTSDSSGDKSQPCWGNNGVPDYWIIKIDSLFNKQWDKVYGGIGDDAFYDVASDHDGNYLLSGSSNTNQNGDKQSPTQGSYDYWIVKIDSSGNYLWDKSLGGTQAEDIVGYGKLCSDNGWLISGTSYSDSSGDKSENNFGQEHTWIIKVDSSGNKLWDKTVLTSNPMDDENGFALEDGQGCYVMANFTPADTGFYKTQMSWGGSDYWLVKFCDTTLGAFVPSVNLMSSDTNFCEKKCIDFFDLSTNNPTQWLWLFPGSDSAFSILQNPANICYNNYGSFDVTLIACNAFGCDTLIFSNFINAFQNPVDSIWVSNDTLFSLQFPSYQWYEIASGIIAGATNQYFVPTQLGSYYCVVNDSIGCIATSNTIAVTAVPPLSFGEGLGVRFFPNPNNGTFEIVINLNPFGDQKVSLQIFGSLGQLVFNSKLQSQKIKLDLPNGIYQLVINSNNEIFKHTFIVSK